MFMHSHASVEYPLLPPTGRSRTPHRASLVPRAGGGRKPFRPGPVWMRRVPRRNWCMSEEPAALQEQTFAGATRATAGSYPPGRRLSARQPGDDLDRRAVAVIGSCRPDGRPDAAMSACIRRGREFWLPAAGGSVRERNVRARPWPTMTITAGDRDAHVVV